MCWQAIGRHAVAGVVRADSKRCQRSRYAELSGGLCQSCAQLEVVRFWLQSREIADNLLMGIQHSSSFIQLNSIIVGVWIRQALSMILRPGVTDQLQAFLV